MLKKRTIRREVRFSGRGVHTGKEVTLTLKPSESGRITFRRLDLGGREIELNPKLARAENASLLVIGSTRVRTIEHLLAVLYVFGLDSLEVELDGEEVPIGDGSALPFINLIKNAGIAILSEEKKIIKVIKSLKIEERGAWISFAPHSELSLFYAIDYPHPLIGHQEYQGVLGVKSFTQKIAPGRTFGFLRDVPALLERGLAQGGTLRNAVILDDREVLNPPLRFPDEFVRHKVLDLIGDLALLGAPLMARVEVNRGGHGLHQAGIKALLRATDRWVEEKGLFPSFLSEISPIEAEPEAG